MTTHLPPKCSVKLQQYAYVLYLTCIEAHKTLLDLPAGSIAVGKTYCALHGAKAMTDPVVRKDDEA